MNDNKIKHLEFLQSTISRMNNSSLQVKGWCIAIVAALMAVFATRQTHDGGNDIRILIVTLLPVLVFWFLDSYFLTLEKDLRITYEIVSGLRKSEVTITDFEIMPALGKSEKTSYISVLFSKTEIWFYLMVIGVIALVGLLLR